MVPYTLLLIGIMGLYFFIYNLSFGYPGNLIAKIVLVSLIIYSISVYLLFYEHEILEKEMKEIELLIHDLQEHMR